MTQPLVPAQVATDLHVLLQLGRRLDARPPALAGRSIREFLIAALLQIRDRHGRLLPLHPNPAQSAFEQACSRHNIVLKARQLGVTTWVAARFFINTITHAGTLSVQVAHDQRSAEEIFRIVHRFLAHLPARLREGVLRPSRVNVRQVVFPLLDSEYRVETAADPQAGRGLTIRHLHCSEVAGWPRDAAATLASLRAAVPPDGEIVLESTPAGAGGCFYEEWTNAPHTGYVPHFFPWWLEPSYRKERSAGDPPEFADNLQLATDNLSDDERALIERHGLTLEQIAFRREIRASFRRLAPQEFAEDSQSCFLAAGDCVFDLETIAARLQSCPPPLEARDNESLLVWLPPRPHADYIIGVDPAGGGVAGDFACAQVIERGSGCQCAELLGHLPPQQLATEVARLAREYNHALVVVERNTQGHGVLAYLAAAEKYDRIYEQNGQPGWLTSAVTRPRVISELAALLVTNPELFSSRRLLQECRTFVRRLDGSAAALSGAHDDCVLAMAIAQAVRAEVSENSAAGLAFATLDRAAVAPTTSP